MTSGTTCQYFKSLNLVARFQIASGLQFFGSFVFPPPTHVEDLLLRTYKSFGVAMALQTPLHLQCRGLISDRHIIHAAVAGRTTDTFVYVNTVVEICVIRQIVNANPFDRFAGSKAGPHGFEIGLSAQSCFVAVHAGIGRRHTSRRRCFDCSVTVTTVDAIISDVCL